LGREGKSDAKVFGRFHRNRCVAREIDPELAQAFHALTPGRPRSYVISLSGATASATRTARIAKFRSHILAGKGAMER
jgi:uncharacterized protein YdeI (YjbR/CyaY-like superfamily)